MQKEINKFNKSIISIVCIVKNDRDIARTLKHLSEIKIEVTHEIIVVDASNGKLDDIKEKFKNVKWINFKSKSNKRITIPEQRNVGINKSQGNIIVFIDANCIPTKDWLYELTKDIVSGKENIVAGGIGSVKDDKIWRMNKDTLNTETYLHEAPTMNLAIKKEVFERIGYFDENFRYGSDADLTFRAVKFGYRIKYNQNAYVSHDWGTFKQQMKRAFRYGQARVLLYSKHKDKWKNMVLYNYTTIFYPVFIIFSPIGLFFPQYFLLLLIPVVKNYKNNPLKVTFFNLIYGFGVLNELLNIKKGKS